MTKSENWIWLTSLPTMTPGKITRLLERFDTVDDIFDATEAEYRGISDIGSDEISDLCDKSMDRAELILEVVEKFGAYILYYDRADYPSALRYCFDPPYVLYVFGERLMWDRLFCISVVGTRRCSDYGVQITHTLSYDLARNGATIVSGMARGLDGVAHNAALKAGGKTIAFLGCGINIVYPREHDGLMKAIAENGAVITEFMPGTEANSKNFPYRNRLMAAMSQGVLITESPRRSGTHITADWALNMGKDVFAVPGDYDRVNSQGCNELIKSGTAKLVDSAVDILIEYERELTKMGIKAENFVIEKKRIVNKEPVSIVKKASIDDPKYQGLSDNEKKILAVLIESNAHIDEICRKADIAMSDVNAGLVMLELSGLVNQLAGKNFSISI